MFTLLFYTCVCVIVSGILTVTINLFKPIHKKGESKPWLTWIFLFALCFSGPYAYTEGLTKTQGKALEPAIKEIYNSVDVTGPMQYYRIIGFRKDKEATVYIVGLERVSWGGTDRPIVSAHLVYEKGAWNADHYKIIYSDRLNKDGYTFPPYW